MTDAEKLMDSLKPLRHPATCKYWEHDKTLADCDCGLTEARELAGRVEVENAALNWEIKHLREVIHHYVDLQSASRLPAEGEQ